MWEIYYGVKYISSQKLKELKQELEELRKKRQEIAAHINEAKEKGDLAENAEYAEAKESQAFNEGRIQELKQILKEAIIISKKKKCDVAEVGCRIIARNKNGKREFTIVGSEEAEPAQGKISNESPLGRVFLGKKKGDEVLCQTPKGKVYYKILEIK